MCALKAPLCVLYVPHTTFALTHQSDLAVAFGTIVSLFDVVVTFSKTPRPLPASPQFLHC